MYYLGECFYYGGKDLKKNENQAFYYYKKAAELGHPGAQFTLGNHYQHGHILEKDLKKAAYWYQKSADQGYAGSQNQLGKLYEYGHGVERNTDRALEYYKMAANQGITEAQERLESLKEKKAYLVSENDSGEKWCFLGKYADEEKDYAEAFRCYKKSAELGYARGQYELGICYSTPKGVTLDEEQAINWKLKAAENGYAEAQYQIGLYYEIGIGSFKKDLKQARFWYQKAADQGHSKAKKQLEDLLGKDEKGKQELEDFFARIRAWRNRQSEKRQKTIEKKPTAIKETEGYSKSASTSFQETPEDWYKRGIEEAYKKNNIKEAVKWYKKAAEQGYAPAQVKLGDYYEAQYNRGEAVYWYQKAADQGDSSAQWRLENPLPEPDLDLEPVIELSQEDSETAENSNRENDKSSLEESGDLAEIFNELFGPPSGSI